MKKKLCDGFALETPDFSKLSLETIDFQPGSKLGKEIEAYFTGVRQTCKNKRDLVDKGNVEVLNEIISRYVKMNVSVDIAKPFACGPHVHLPLINVNHRFFETWYANYVDFDKPIEDFVKKLENSKFIAGVDLKKSQLIGAFTEIKIEINLTPWAVLHNKITPASLTGILLHEVGHAFTFFEYFSTTSTTNQILAYVNQNLTVDKPIKVREDIIQRTAQALGVMVTKPEELAKECNKEKFMALLAKDAGTNRVAQLDSGFYDKTTCEMFADQFAARHGYGKDCILGLDQLGFVMRSKSALLRTVYYALSEQTLITILIAGVGGVLTANPAAIGFALLSFISNVYTNGVQDRDYTYDNIHTRIKRVRDQYIALGKDDTLEKEQVVQIIEAVKTLDTIISQLAASPKFFEAIANFFSKKSSDAKAMLELQGQLESLANNDLFLSAAKLKHIN